MIRILLVDDQVLICQGLKAMLSLEPDLEIVGIAHNGQLAIKGVEALKPDVVLMDVKMPVMDGREATRLIRQSYPGINILILTTFDDDQYILDAMRAGAKGYLLKDMPSEELAQAIRLVHHGYTQLAPGVMEKLMMVNTTPSNAETESNKLENLGLTPREQEVLLLIGQGFTNKEIGKELYISEGTVKTHVNHLLNRLELRNRAELAIFVNANKLSKA